MILHSASAQAFKVLRDGGESKRRPWTDRGQTLKRPKRGVERPKKSMDWVPHKGLTFCAQARTPSFVEGCLILAFLVFEYFLVQIMRQVGRPFVRNLSSY